MQTTHATPIYTPAAAPFEPAQSNELLAKLRANPLLRQIDPCRLEQVASNCTFTRYRAGRRVLREGEAATGVCVLVSGGVRITHQAPGGDEGEAVGQLLGAPALFGEAETLIGIASLESAVTVVPSEVIRIPKESFDRLVRTEPRFAYGLVRDLMERLCIAREHERALAFSPVESRLASFLLDHAKLFSSRLQGGGLLLEVRLSQQLLAGSLAVSRKTINQTMRRWTDEEIIAKRRGRYVILDVEALEKRAVSAHFGLAHRLRPAV